MRSMVAAEVQMPREKTFRPFFSAAAKQSLASFTRRVRAASPGGNRTYPSGTVRTLPSAARTAFGVGPGVKVLASALTADLHNAPPTRSSARPAASNRLGAS